MVNAAKMINKLLNKKEKARDTDFSDFFNNAKSSERKKIFVRVVNGATQRQEMILKEASAKAYL